MKVKVNSVPGWRPVKVSPPKIGEFYLDESTAYKCDVEYGDHEVIATTDASQKGGEEHEVPVEGVPPEYRVVSWKVPEVGELIWIRDGALEEEIQSEIPWLVVEKAE